VENARAAWRSTVARAAVIFFLENENSMLWLGTCEREAMAIKPLGWCYGPRTGEPEGPDILT
jgi:hypothetical protein